MLNLLLVRCLFPLFFVLLSANTIFAQPEVLARADSTIRAYIESHKAFAIAEMRRSGIPASVTLGQAICESRYGTSKVAMQAHNHFGIKCYDTWVGKRYFHKDDEMKNGVLVPSCFRYYTSDSASYSDHSDFLMTRPWYEKLFELESDDHLGWVRGLNKSGYANAKDYDERILKHINKYELFKLDEKGFSLKRNKIAKTDNKKKGKNIKNSDTETPIFIKKDSLLQSKNAENNVDNNIENEVKNTAIVVKSLKTDKKTPVFIAKDTLRKAAIQPDSTELTTNEINNVPDKIVIETEKLTEKPTTMQPQKTPETMTATTEQKPKLQRFTVGKPSITPVKTDSISTPENAKTSHPFGESAKTEVPKPTILTPENIEKTTLQLQKTTVKTHKIAANETLFAIAKKYNVQLDKLMTLNNLTMQTPLKLGQVLRLTE